MCDYLTDRQNAREVMRKIARAVDRSDVNQLLAELRTEPTTTIRVLTAALRCTYMGRHRLSEWALLFEHIKVKFPHLADDYLIGLSVD